MQFSILILITFYLKNINIINASNIDISKCLETGIYCQSLPEDCVLDNSECDTLLIASPSQAGNGEAGVQFELFAKNDGKRHWFEVELSAHPQITSDNVSETYVLNGGQSRVSGQYNQLIKGVKGVAQFADVINENGILSTKWLSKVVTKVQSNRSDILNNKYNILLANGPIDANNNERYQTQRFLSKTGVDLQFSDEQPLNDLYTNCNKPEATALCFGLPDGCIKSQNCHLVLAVTKNGNGGPTGTLDFQLIGKTDDSDSGWIAAALSDDNQMGSDSVVECLVLSNGKSFLRNSWNDGTDNIVIGDVKGINQVGKLVFQNGLLNCKWTRAQNTKVKDTAFDLKSKKYYILLAKGPIDDQTNAVKGFHSEKIPSQTSYDLESQQTTSTTTSPISSTPLPSTLSDAYKRCHNNERLCYGIDTKSSNCMDSNDCTVLFSSVPKGGGAVEIELYWNRGSSSSDHWTAVALSTDQSMGRDSVTECILKSDGSVVLRSGWNPGPGTQGTLNVVDNSTTSLKTSFESGVVYCKWHRNGISSIEGNEFNIANDTFYLILAYGPLKQDESNIRQHSLVKPSSEKVNLQSVGILKSQSPIYVQLHATFMIIGWLGCVAIAMLMARHYKNSWPDSTLCGVKIWFAFHRFLMILGVTLVLTSTILIFVNKKGWVGASAHPIVGLTSIILCFLQPIGALFRPNPDSSNRWLFNWLHWSGGYIGYILSFVAICLSTKFKNLLPEQTLGVLIAYIIVYILSHVLHHLKTILRNRQKTVDTQNTKSGPKRKLESLMDLTLALVNVVIIGAFVLALVILLFI